MNHEAFDWEEPYRHHVGAALTMAVVGGVVLGALTRGGRFGISRNGQVTELANRVSGALADVAAGAVMAFMSEMIPGFRDALATRKPR